MAVAAEKTAPGRTPPSAPSRWHVFDRERVLGPLLLLPAVLFLAALVGFPLVLAILYAFSDVTVGNPALHLTGLSTFHAVFEDPVFRTSLRNTFVFTLASEALVIVLSTILAFALTADFRGKWLVRFLVLLPWTTPVALAAIAWLWMLHSIFSPIDWVLGSLGIISEGSHVVWLGKTHLAMGSVIVVQAWRILPLATVILMAGLSAIPKDVEEQAEIDGAGFWRKLFGVTLPLLMPIVAVAVLFGIVFTFTDMTVIFVLTRGGPQNATQVLASWAFFRGIEGGDLAQGAAVALFMFPVLVGLTAVVLRLARRAEVA